MKGGTKWLESFPAEKKKESETSYPAVNLPVSPLSIIPVFFLTGDYETYSAKS
jgi:hypothetical protein